MSFLTFLLRHKLALNHLRHLTLVAPIHGLSYPAAQFLASTIMVESPPVARLILYGDWEGLLAEHPQISDAFVHLTSIRALHILPVGKKCLAMVRRMRSPLTSIHFAYEPQSVIGLSAVELVTLHPLSAIYSVRDSLAKLSLTWSIAAEPNPDVVTTYPLLRTLELVDIVNPTVGPYITAFPNLSTLSAATILEDVTDDATDPLLIMRVAGRRSANQAAQDIGGSWQMLSQFTGTVFGLYLLGLRCEVVSLDLDLSCEPFEWFRAILGDTRPSTVLLTILDWGSNALADDHPPHAPHQTDGANSINLTVRLILSDRGNQADLETWLVCE